jgi:hypothetical protein
MRSELADLILAPFVLRAMLPLLCFSRAVVIVFAVFVLALVVFVVVVLLLSCRKHTSKMACSSAPNSRARAHSYHPTHSHPGSWWLVVSLLEETPIRIASQSSSERDPIHCSRSTIFACTPVPSTPAVTARPHSPLQGHNDFTRTTMMR